MSTDIVDLTAALPRAVRHPADVSTDIVAVMAVLRHVQERWAT